MKKISVYTNHFEPENFKINDIVKELSTNYLVDVTTQIPNYPKGKFFDGYGYFKRKKETKGNVSITRLNVVPRGSHKIMLLLNYLSYIISTYIYSLKKRKEKTDGVFIYITSPIFVSWAAIRHANYQSAPKVMYLLDLWPDNLISMLKIKNKFLVQRIQNMCLKIYNQMDTIFISSLEFKAVLVKYGVDENKIKYLPQHVELLEVKSNRQITESLNILFAGNIGEAQGLDLLVDLSKELKKRDFQGLHFEILGDGRYKDTLISKVLNNDVNEYFTFYDSVSPKEVMNYYQKCNFGLVILGDDENINRHLPAKVQGYMANKVPILAFAEGETSRVIRQSDSGYVISYKSIPEMTNELIRLSDINQDQIELWGINGYNYAQEHFDLNDQISEILIALRILDRKI